MLIAIFALLLISVVGIALLLSTGTDSALAGNYRTSTAAYYAAVAGLEEGRGRLLWRNTDFINKTNAYPTLFTAQGNSTFGLNDVLYIVNPMGGETVNPLDPSSPYADTEYAAEFSWGLGGANVYAPINSVSPLAGSSPSIPGPLYKWVRINAVTELALNLDVDGAHASDGTTPLSFSGLGLYRPGAGIPSPSPNGLQALEITAFAYMPDKSSKLLQYLVAPNTLQYYVAPTSLLQGFPGALTLAGNGVTFTGPNSSSFYINGTDPTAGRSCTSPPLPATFAIGYTNPADQPTISAGTTAYPGNYSGLIPAPPAPATPSAGVVGLPLSLQKPSQLNALVQTITQNADAVIAGPATGANLSPLGMLASNPMTIVVNGDLNLSGWYNTGFGILLVTGNLTYDGASTWQGIVLVIGKGTVTGVPSGFGVGRIDGAMLVAQTLDGAGNPLPDPSLGASSFIFDPATAGNGIYYNSCTMLQALAPNSYRVLSFREITPP